MTTEQFDAAYRAFCRRRSFRPFLIEFTSGYQVQVAHPEAVRNEVARVRERARAVRLESKQKQQKPDWAVVRLQIAKPLAEVRNRISEELARRQSSEALVPIDRDPVPNKFSDLVRKYYEKLGGSEQP